MSTQTTYKCNSLGITWRHHIAHSFFFIGPIWSEIAGSEFTHAEEIEDISVLASLTSVDFWVNGLGLTWFLGLFLEAGIQER